MMIRMNGRRQAQLQSKRAHSTMDVNARAYSIADVNARAYSMTDMNVKDISYNRRECKGTFYKEKQVNASLATEYVVVEENRFRHETGNANLPKT
jgi:hypothetical protein